MLEHACQLDHLAELHLAPLPTHTRRAQRSHQVLRFVLQLLLRVANQVEQRLHARAVVDACAFDFLELRINLDERVLDRRDERAKLLLTAREIDSRFAVHVADLLVGKFEEFVGAGLERGGGERLECVAEVIVLRSAVTRSEQPSGGKTSDQRQDGGNSKFQ